MSQKPIFQPQACRAIAVIGRSADERIGGTLDALVALIEERGLHAWRAASAASALEISRQQNGSCDLAIVVGGDGSMLHAACALAAAKVPVLGVNRGRLGFLTDTSPEHISEMLDTVLSGHCHEQLRFLLSAEIIRDGKVINEVGSLNDVVVSAGTSASMLEFDLKIDEQFVYRQHSDGLIVATPTGSTAYALSGGGPIMHPKIEGFVLVPMCPHTLSSRPLVVSIDSILEICIRRAHHRADEATVSCDGNLRATLNPADSVRISKRRQPLRLLHPPHYNFYAACRDKLGWSGASPQFDRSKEGVDGS